MVQPDCAGVIPFGPVSWYGVDSPCADSGFAGTMMSQLTFAAVVVVPVLVVADAVGHGAAELTGTAVDVAGAVVAVAVLEAAVVGAAVPVAAVVGAAVLEAAVVAEAVPDAAAVGDAVPPPPWWWAELAGTTYAAGEAQLAFAASATLFAPEWSTTATIAPTATTSANGMPIGAAKRASGPLDRRRPADRCLLGMQSTSMS
ncbi:MAG: hypothetical protein ACRDP7_48180 [Trebonia sp.]